MHDVQKSLLRILSNALWGKAARYIYSESEWEKILTRAEDQGVLFLILQRCKWIRPQLSSLNWVKWRSKLVSTMLHNESLMEMQNGILNRMRSVNIPCIILKGASLAACYEDPSSRALGDIDLLVPPDCVERAAKVLRKYGFQAPEESYQHPYHIDFYRNGTAVELHFAVSTFPESDAGNEAARFMDSCWDDIQYKRISDFSVPCLGDSHQALCLLLHMQRHMTTGCIGLRQLCDWAVFVRSISADRFAGEILPVLKKCGLARFAGILTAAAVHDLGLEPEYGAWCSFVSKRSIRTMMDEILRAGSIHNRNNTDDVSNFFVEVSGTESAMHVFLGKINALAKRKYPITKKLPILLPLYWAYIPLRYWIRSLAGKRRRKSLLRTIQMTKQRKQLYQELRLFQVEKERAR